MSSIAFQRGGVATISLAKSPAGERVYRLDMFSASGAKVSFLVGREELRRFAATLLSYTAGTPPTGVPETGP